MQQIPFIGRITAIERLLQQNFLSVLLRQLIISVSVRMNQFRQRSKRLATLDRQTFFIMLDLHVNHFISTPAAAAAAAAAHRQYMTNSINS